MKVGIIGLGRMGEGMSRRMIKAGIEVHGYRNNVQKANEQFEKGYISGYATSLESLVQVVHSQKSIYGEKSGETIITKAPGVFMMVVPAETVEETLNGYYSFVWREILLLIMAIAILRTLDKGQREAAKLGIQYIDCGTSGGVYGLDRGYCLMVGGTTGAVSTCAPIFRALAPGIGSASRTNPLDYETSSEHGWLHCGPPGAGHFVKMVHNGIEYGIMQAYAEGFNILHEANAGSKYVKEGDAEVAPMAHPEDYCYDIDVAEVS